MKLKKILFFYVKDLTEIGAKIRAEFERRAGKIFPRPSHHLDFFYTNPVQSRIFFSGNFVNPKFFIAIFPNRQKFSTEILEKFFDWHGVCWGAIPMPINSESRFFLRGKDGMVHTIDTPLPVQKLYKYIMGRQIYRLFGIEFARILNQSS